MKRDIDLVREILLEMAKWPAGQRSGAINIANRDDAEITAHIGLMHDAGLIEAVDASSHDGEAWIPMRITWEGYEFIDAARSDTVWRQAKQKALNTEGVITIEVMKIALQGVIRQMMSAG